MRRAALLGVLATLGLSGCADDSQLPATAELRVRDEAGVRVVRTRAWPLSPGIVVALAARSDGRVVVAQRARVTVLDGAQQALGPGRRVVGLSRDATTVAVARGRDVRVGPALESTDGRTALRVGFGNSLTVLSGNRQRIVSNGLWELARPGRVWRPQSYGRVQAVDPREQVLALTNEDTASVRLLDLRDGTQLDELPRRARGRTGARIEVVDLDAARRAVWLDQRGWMTCDGVAGHVLPPAPAGMPAAVLLTGRRAWALRGGRAVLAECGPDRLRVLCSVSGSNGDLRSASLVTTPNGVVAAGLVRARVVMLPNCR